MSITNCLCTSTNLRYGGRVAYSLLKIGLSQSIPCRLWHNLTPFSNGLKSIYRPLTCRENNKPRLALQSSRTMRLSSLNDGGQGLVYTRRTRISGSSTPNLKSSSCHPIMHVLFSHHPQTCFELVHHMPGPRGGREGKSPLIDLLKQTRWAFHIIVR